MPSLHDMRRRRALTQTALAKQVGVSKSAISAYESGKKVPTYPVAKKMGAALGVPWNEVHETAWRARKRRQELEAQVAPLGEELRAIAVRARGNDDLKALLALIAADAFDGVLKVELEE